jgi:Fe2+ transport system protein FeoA
MIASPVPTARVDSLVPVSFLERGQSAIVAGFVGPPEQIHRLHELGFRCGALLIMVQPGSPCIVRLQDQRVCFRQSDLIGILVRPE